MKEYIKPLCTFIQLKAEERLAGSMCECNGQGTYPVGASKYVHT
jgi:hypothetical protein